MRRMTAVPLTLLTALAGGCSGQSTTPTPAQAAEARRRADAALTLIERKDYRRAREEAEAACDLDRTAAVAWYARGLACWNLGDKEQADRWLGMAAHFDHNYLVPFQMLKDGAPEPPEPRRRWQLDD
jgi:Tfp pilus assembly protein PilF